MRFLLPLAIALAAPAAIAAPAANFSELLNGGGDRSATTIEDLERLWESQYEGHLQVDRANALSAAQIRSTLDRFARADRRAALIYLAPGPEAISILAVTPEGEPLSVRVPISEARLDTEIARFATALQHPILLPPERQRDYLPIGQQLYQWLLAPIAEELRARNIDTLLLCTGPGLRSLSFAALHDGEKFLVEEFSLTRLAAFSLTDFGEEPDDEPVPAVPTALQDSSVLAMGTGEFDKLPSLPGVPIEVRLVASGSEDWWFIDRDFTRDRLELLLGLKRFDTVHLATHAEFLPGEPATSYIQFWDAPLGLDAMATLGWETAGVELLVLSACKTAVGDRQAELGFAGLAYNAGVESVVASHWPVDDAGTLALMSEFYTQLRRVPTRAEALRAAQIVMLRGAVWAEEGALRGGTRGVALTLPSEIAGNTSGNRVDFSHPYFWASFSLIGNPW